MQYDSEPQGQHKYTWDKARRVLNFSAARGAAASNQSQAAPPSRCPTCMKGRDLCKCEDEDEDEDEEPSLSPVRASQSSPKKSFENPSSESYLSGCVDGDDEPTEREETDSGFAQWDRVEHTKRGLGRVIGFFGEFVMVQYDDEPHGKHKYSWEQAKKKVSIIGWEPPSSQ